MLNEYDCLVIGGGPAGATAATVLAAKGRSVLILEKEHFPRYIVGESLLPYCYFPLERIGMIDKLRASGFPKKYSVQFVGRSGKVSQPFYFFEHLDHAASQTWQVPRGEFDQMLLDNAREKGAQVCEGMTVKALREEKGAVVGVRAMDEKGESHEFAAPMTIDASGRTGFSTGQKGWRVRDEKLKKVALWTYYEGAMRDPGRDEGATTVAYLPENGWFWYIPLPDDKVSVGVVADRDYLYRDSREPEMIFAGEVGNNRWIEEHLAPGRRIEGFRVTGDYSYRSRYCGTHGLLLTGDAFAFLDPVFSSGVFLALRGGELAGDAVDAVLKAGETAGERFAEYGKILCAGIEAMRKLVYAFYDPGFTFRDLLMKHGHVRADLTDCLIGHLEKDFGELFKAVAEFAAIPAPLDYGGPLLPGQAELAGN